MSSSPQLHVEQTRLEALRRFGILDTSPEEAFDDLVHTAALVCRTPISLICLVDETRLWFKARKGIDLDEVSRESGFCTLAIRGSDLLVVPDAHEDPRFASNPLVSDSHIRFYAGAPVITPDGLALGTICVLDRVPRSIGPDEAKALGGLARQVMIQLELRRALIEMEERTAELDAFSSMAAHDLRAPLRAVRGFSEVLKQEFVGKVLTGEGEEAVVRIIEATGKMDALIQGLLAYARLSRHDVVLEPVALGPLLDQVLHDLAPELESRQAAIDFPSDLPVVRAHRLLLGQALTNLLSNAIKFVEPGIRPRVTVSANPRDGRVVLTVTDNGIGIAAEFKDRIFKPFSRLHGQGGPFPGVGMGLAIVRKCAERLGGRAGVDSEAGKGSMFWIELPLTKAEA
jgi:signal transduction histidine kinase